MYPDMTEQGTTTTTQTVIMGVAPTIKGYVHPSIHPICTVYFSASSAEIILARW